ncbi:MAG TPA: 3'(2'),5'-bisphosphate nucleotidase CysQ [Xanthobacteraceae bacterium]|nr:3'(2'),5'-bisphosphate nucleotidase CysQ [Xanthobacteraceae bacterium]
MEIRVRDEFAAELGTIVAEAGKVIMALQPSDIGARRKPDGSPVCQADLRAERLILGRLAALMPSVPVIAEESFVPDDAGPVPECFFLVDPLDGTREFLAGHKDFTVNIALIEAGGPVAGAICAPALDQVYVGGATAFGADMAAAGAAGPMKPIATSPVPGAGLRALASRSHLNAETEQWLSQQPVAELQRAGSSLKFCLIARGDADVYPRLAATMEWDTAAGHAVLNAAGGYVLGLDGSPLRYGKKDAGFKNAGFIAWGRRPPE